jgi:23S rRNA (cytidine1920-2'-O)/16S rRNA (cytidine1409-2'-O)-methyltransferase
VKQRIDQLLVARGHFDSRSKAAAAIAAGGVKADGKVVAKPSEQIDEDALIDAAPAHPWVGRGALKLDHALTLWPIAVEGRAVLDVGASTGGFTEVCLARGARRVTAVDVGRGQLHLSLAADPRVTNLEATDARDLTAAMLGQPADLIVCDASFIGLAKVLAQPLELAAETADLVALVKPQFEAGPAAVGKGGLVKDEAVHAHVVAGVVAWLEAQDWRVRETAASPIEGGEGQREYLLWAARA